MKRGASPLYGFISTRNIKNGNVLLKTKGNTEGYKSLTAKLATNHGAVQVTVRESGDIAISLIPWKSKDGIYRGIRKEILSDNLRDIEDRESKQLGLPLGEHLAHQEYAEAQ